MGLKSSLIGFNCGLAREERKHFERFSRDLKVE